MNLAAIDIGTNSIHMILVKVQPGNRFEILMQEKSMVKLGVGVFAKNKISPDALERGVETIKKYVQLADQYGVDDIIVNATSASREAKNGREFLDRLIQEAGISPRLISGKEEARLIFLAVKEAISIKKEKVLVLDIGGGSTEAVVGDEHQIYFGNSMKLGVLRLLDKVGHSGPLTKEAQQDLKRHIRKAASKLMDPIRETGFNRVIGTSGTIRSLAESCLEKTENPDPERVNAEEIRLEELVRLRDKLIGASPEARGEIPGISPNRSDAIHLGALLLVELLQLVEADRMTISDASLREGMILHYIEKNKLQIGKETQGKNLREKSCIWLANRYETELDAKKHVSGLALQLFDQLKSLHGAGEQERSLLYHAALIYDVGLYVKFQDYHKHSRYIINHSQLRGFTNEEVLLLGHLARYHRKKGPKKRHKKFKRLTAPQQKQVRLLAGILRIAIGLDKTKNQWVQTLYCLPNRSKLEIQVFAEENIALELWEAQRFSDTLSSYLKKDIHLTMG
ncbi:exopolyphosphatase / guanosine-5'-triphosphate,3'-diphosphate pyrophosphatase [Cyclobacterium xiamenense]|uniref:Exopolyphosphatase / guanosine-5'-triphosphate,3'-diphosphate pyrophosphatase n=1 Tax=Cyclobacterium xiamenense TaxID=1297121 RepID=A0A1H6YRE8_9BACT|nr:Ppx/GppA phosphatase family protein [Cyclobacterium xiamenense]SEJ41527.1 exopolyphosphatase / guanosine-5'-triphosphate,3'-diphosphate pyrophosphatase [Cyclobacterium xiamenense]